MAEQQKIKVMLVFDAIGRPAEHLVASLEELVKDIEKEKGVTVKMKDIKKPGPMKENTDFYTTFVEVEVELEDMLYLAILMFKFMPAHVEIISPEILAMTNSGWNDVFNELARRLHAYDEVARVTQIEKNFLLKKIEELGGNLNELVPVENKEEDKE